MLKFKKKHSVASAPYRISLGGGGTDLPFYASKNEGFMISASIDEYITVMVAKRSLDKDIFLQYSETERVNSIDKVSHQIIRELLKYFKIYDSFQVATFSTMPTFTGLGASSTLIVAFIKSIRNLMGQTRTNIEIAEEAFHVEREILGLAGGYQDQYISSLGGIQIIKVSKDLKVACEPLVLGKKELKSLQESIFLIYTTIERRSENIIEDQKKKLKSDDKLVLDAYDQIKSIGIRAVSELTEGRIREFGIGMDDHWKIKKTISSSISSTNIDTMYEEIKSLGALGGKIIGAGGGGFFMMVVDKQRDLFKEKLVNNGYKVLDFKFEFNGAHVLK